MTNSLYLKKAELSGYKSINDVEIELHKGLNVIIGKNAVGKTNFLSFLDKCLNFNLQTLNVFKSSLIFKKDFEEIKINYKKEYAGNPFYLGSIFNYKVENELYISNQLYHDIKYDDNIQNKLIQKNILFSSNFICHGIPQNLPLIDIPLSASFVSNQPSSNLIDFASKNNNSFFLYHIAIGLTLKLYKINEIDLEKIKNDILIYFNSLSYLGKILREFSPIQDIRISENFNVFLESEKKMYTINNLFFEFKINNNWLPFSNLSDGSKRLFLIISEVFDNYPFFTDILASNKVFNRREEVSRIILIEEPELGIHPHQFHKLLEFLKIESNSKQIIISTHSPQTLDAISEEELYRIIIAYNDKIGNTKLRHLDENEMKKAKDYIKDDFLSDYWLYSDLEK